MCMMLGHARKHRTKHSCYLIWKVKRQYGQMYLEGLQFQVINLGLVGPSLLFYVKKSAAHHFIKSRLKVC
jgi:hypothetical protein